MVASTDDEQKCVDLTAQDDQAAAIDIEEDEEADDTEVDACCICQDVVRLVQQGFLSSCDHRFHFDCIVTWSKVTNLCPLCKLKFHDVIRKDADGDVVHREAVADTTQVFRPDPHDHDMQAQLRLVNNVRCELCGRGDDEHVLLMCEAPECMHSSHTYCIGLDDIPSHAWYCARHEGSPARASDLISRRASTVSSRRQTRRLASLMTNIINGVGAVRRRGAASATGATHTRRLRARLAMPDGDGLDVEHGRSRPIRGVALSYAVHMSRELQAVQQRADAMFARGDLGASALYAPPRGSLLGARSTVARSPTDQMWEDRARSQRQFAEAVAASQPSSDSPLAGSTRANLNRVSPTFASEYRDLAKRMMDAASHDNYASTVSLTIPKTARLRLVSSVKAFFGKLNAREKVAALEAGCLGVLFLWVKVGGRGGGGGDDTALASKDLHPHVLETVLLALEGLPVRKEDLAEVRGFSDVLDEISDRSNISLEFRERCIVLSELWRALDPPPAPSVVTTVNAGSRSQPLQDRESAPPLPAIQSFAAVVPNSGRLSGKRKASHRSVEGIKKRTKRSPEEWTAMAVDYVKAKLYPLYKDSKGNMSKDQFKTVVKQVLERFRGDAAKMQSAIVETSGASVQLTSIAKQRLMQLLDQVYRASCTFTPSSLPSTRVIAQTNASYSATSGTATKRARTL